MTPGWEARGEAVVRYSRGIFDKESRMTGALPLNAKFRELLCA
jgi:hypothetical protein